MDSPTNIRIAVAGRFSLNRVRRGDEYAYVEHMADAEITRNTMAIPFPYTEAHASEWIAFCETQARDPEVRFAIRESSDNLVGGIGVVGDLPAGASEAEFGYWLAKPYRGLGIMTRVTDCFALYVFAQLGLRRLYATPFSRNLASQRVLEKAGFRREELMPHRYVKNGEHLDAVLCARLFR